MSYLTLKNISKSYNQKDQIIKDLSLEVQRGEFIVIVGPSGCGKSTLLRMIAGLETISSGKIIIDSKTVNQIPPAKRDIAMVFQNYALYPHMNVEENLSYGLKNRKISKDEISKRVNEISKLLQIDELLKRKPSQLSGGQKQRVAMGRAIIRKPKLFLFDEPLSNLDAKLRHQMRIEIRKLHDKLGITSIYVTHDQVEAMTLADRIIILNQGKIEQIGTPSEIYKKPKTVFVSKFMGTPPMNVLKLAVEKNSLTLFNKNIPLKINYENDYIYVGIRAEDIALEKIKESIEFDIYIDMIEHLGSESLIYTTINKQQLVIKSNHFLEKKESSIKIYIDPNKLYFFDYKSLKNCTNL